MDISSHLELSPAPRAVFDRLDERRSRPRFMMPTADGDWQAITWAAYATQIRQIGMFLTGVGLKSGDRGAILSHNCLPWIVSALGIQAVGGVMVPIYPSNTAALVGHVVEHSDARFVFIGDAALLEKLLLSWDRCDHVVRIIGLDPSLDAAHVIASMRARGLRPPPVAEVLAKFTRWHDALARGAAHDAEAPDRFMHLLDAISIEQDAVMLYTSGTTGMPKGVPLTHRNVGANGRDWMVCNAPLIDEGAIDLFWLPLSHIFGFGELCLGNTLGFLTYWCDPADTLARLPEVRPDVFMSVPRLFEKLAMSAAQEPHPERQRARLMALTGGRLKFCLSGGAGLKREVKQLFHQHGLLIIEGYGLTESSPTLTLNRPDAFRFDSVGKPLPSVQLKLAEDGEILARGPNVFRGYHKDPEATRGAFTEDGWLKTGDIGRWTDDGFLQIIDRKKEILVTAGGKNIPPANIEVRFQDDPYIAHVVVYGDNKPFISAGVWLNEPSATAWLDAQGVGPSGRHDALRKLIGERIERANEQLARYEAIKKFVIMDEPLTVEAGLLTPTLKVKRKKVYERFHDSFEALYEA